LGHLGQAIEAHTRGDWAAANSQLRTFFESVFDDVARAVRSAEAAQLATAENRRGLLADAGFFSVDRHEWTRDGKNFVNDVFKMLHTEGSHPGLSDEDHSTFRMHLVLVTARTFLRCLYTSTTNGRASLVGGAADLRWSSSVFLSTEHTEGRDCRSGGAARLQRMMRTCG
jgi:hypothetical protein